MILHQIEMVLFGVLCGSILFGRFLPRVFKKIDVTELSPDHNPGTYNAMKYAGPAVGLLCLAGDLLKGAIPVSLSIHMELMTGMLFPLIMAAPVFGHAYSLFHHGRGGKAIAVSFGVLIGLLPANISLLVWLCILYLICSLVIVVNPHTKRTRVTFRLFAAGTAVLLILQEIPLQAGLGALLIAGIVIHKNSVRQQEAEAGRAAGRAAEQQEPSLEIL